MITLPGLNTCDRYATIHGKKMKYEIWFMNAFDSFIPVIIWNIFKFTSSVLLGTQILPDGSSIVLHLSSYLSKLTINK